MKLSRRTFLRGAAGAVISLPFLEAMAPAGYTSAPKRLVCVHIPNGFRHTAVYAPTSGTPYGLPAVFQPLAPMQSKLTMITNLDNSIAVAAGADHHSGGTGALLTAYPCQQSGSVVDNGTSVDQVYGAAVGNATPIASLPVGVATYSNYSVSPVLCSNISWQSGMPVSKELDAVRLWQRLFSQLALPPSQLAAIRAQKETVLNGSVGDAQLLRQKLGAQDRAKLDQYLAGVTALENKVMTDSTCLVPPPPEPGLLTNDGEPSDASTTGVSAHIDTMFDLIAHAFACDLTRSVTFMFPDGGFTSWQFIGFGDQHHALTHDPDDPAIDPTCNLTNAQKIDAICTWQSQRILHLLQALDAIQDADGRTILDNTLVLVTSDVGDGALHTHDTMPVLLAGGGGTVTKTGQLVVAGPGDQGVKGQQPFANLFMSMLEFAGVPTTTFGASTLNAKVLAELMV